MELGCGGGGAGLGGVPHPQGCPDGGQLEEDAPPLLGTHGLQLRRAHLQQLLPRQHPQTPHRAGDGQMDRQMVSQVCVPPLKMESWGSGGSRVTYMRWKPLSFSQAVTSAGEESGCRLGGLS